LQKLFGRRKKWLPATYSNKLQHTYRLGFTRSSKCEVIFPHYEFVTKERTDIDEGRSVEHKGQGETRKSNRIVEAGERKRNDLALICILVVTSELHSPTRDINVPRTCTIYAHQVSFSFMPFFSSSSTSCVQAIITYYDNQKNWSSCLLVQTILFVL
jgi:hypothetical protein